MNRLGKFGVEEESSAKQYNDRILQLKCITIAKDHRLTARESEILLLLAQGIRAPEIEDTLGISIDTVRSHIKHLYAKLDVHSFKDLHKLLKDFTISDEEPQITQQGFIQVHPEPRERFNSNAARVVDPPTLEATSANVADIG